MKGGHCLNVNDKCLLCFGTLSDTKCYDRKTNCLARINQVCDKGKGSVPRGRVYSNYVSRCATERVTVLNPASFGKLVRVLFPGLKTRRLGVRGESKYHYVNFSLQEDQPEMAEPRNHHPVQSFHEPQPSFTQSFVTRYVTSSADTMKSHSFLSHTMAPIPQFATDRAAFPSPIVQMPEPAVSHSGSFARPHSLYHQPEIIDVDQLDTSGSKITQQLRFLPQTESPNGNAPIDLPKIDTFLPIGTDLDAAKALSALYRSHCISLVDSIRFCKEKTFFHLFTAFHGTLTMPVQKLFAHPGIARWIKECDFAMYQKMVVVLSALTLQVVPKQILDTLRNISARLVPHIQNTFQTLPAHVVAAKVGPATLFAGLLDRKLRVNLTAHAAANMLCNPANRDQMYHDFITEVRTRKVAECVPTRGMDDVVNLLLTEMRHLLDPVNVLWEVESRTPYGQMAARTGQQQQADIHADTSTENVLDRWVNFLTSLPANFPYATHAEIVWCVQAVGTAVMRDLTIAQCKSFGAWWVTKCWIDEMIAFTAEEGGFMEYKSAPETNEDAPIQPFLSRTSHRESRYSSASDDFLRDTGHGDSMSLPRPMDITSQAAMNAAAACHDDSGIGMQTPEHDYSKYEYVRDDVGTHINHHRIAESAV
jgi:regulatory factor X